MKTLVEKFGFDTSTNPPLFVTHSFVKSGTDLEHLIDGAVRAQINELYVVDYLASKNIAHLLTEKEVDTVLQGFSDL